MHRLRQLFSLSSTGAALALGTAMALVIVSCSTSPTNPVSPSTTTPDATAGGGGIVKATETPSPTPTSTVTPTPTPGNCSPGFYKNHALDNPGNQENVWFGASFGFCDNLGQPECQDLLDALNAGGQTSQKAAAYLNSVTGLQCDD